MADETRTLAWKLLVNTEGIEKNTASAASSLKTIATEAKLAGAAIAAIAGSRLVRGIIDAADSMAEMSNQLDLVTRSAGEAAVVTDALRASAQSTGTPIETAVSNYQRFAQALNGYGLTSEQVVKITETSTKMMKLYGSEMGDSETQVKTLALAFNQGTLGQMQFQRLLREMPGLADALGNSFSGGKEALLSLVKEGKFSGQMLKDALMGAADDIDQKWADRAPTFARSFVQLQNQVKFFLEDFEKSTGFFRWLADELAIFTKEDLPALISMFKTVGQTVKDQFEIASIVVKGTLETLVALIKYIGAAADEPFLALAARVKAGFLLVVNDVRTTFQVLLATVQEWLGKVAASLVGLIPDFAAKRSKDLQDFKDHYSKVDQASKDAVANAKADGEAREMIIRSNMQSELTYAATKTGLAKMDFETKQLYWNKELTAAQQTQQRRKEIEALLPGIAVTAGKIRPGAGEPITKATDKQGADELAKAIQSLNNEYQKIRDNAQLTAYEIENGTEAMKNYKIALDMRRATEEKIAALQASKRGLSADEAQALRDLTERNITAAQAQGRFADSAALIKSAIEAGTTPVQKANEEIAKLKAAYEDMPTGVRRSAEEMAKFNKHLEDLQKQADPAAKALENLKDQSRQLDIQYAALAISMTQGDTAARIYTETQMAQLQSEKQLQALVDQGVEKGSERYNQVQAEIAANAERTNGLITEGEQRKALLDVMDKGTSSTDNARKQAELATEAFRKFGDQLDEKQVARFNAGMKQLGAEINPLIGKFQDAALQMGDAFVGFIIDANQSFSEFVANTIKDIGRMIAQFYMMKAIKMALGMPFEAGAAFEGGKVIPFQRGGVVDTPVTFPLRGARGLMGEAGPEAVMPLARLPGGDLGVKSQPLNLEVINQTGVNATARVRTEADRTQLILEAAQLGATMAQSNFNTSVSSGYGASATNLQRTYGLARRKA